jgi:signal transduction histidine kinase
MNGRALKILITDDDEGDRKQIKRAIGQAGLSAECTETASIREALEACEGCEFDCAIVDYRLPGEDGLEGITALHARLPDMAIVMSTGQGDEAVATEAMKRGAADYISKSRMNAATIHRAIASALERSALQRKVKEQQDELENFARVLAHDLRAPAGAVQTFALRIGEMLETGNPAKALQYADWVVQRAQRMNQLIDTLHQYTTADAKATFESVDMNQVFHESRENLQRPIQQSGAIVTAEELPAIVGNVPQLIQLLQNLIGNGIKYCDGPAPRVHLAATRRDEDAWLFSVTDNGIGIPEEHRKRIFDPFVRVSASSKREGTGLGLATCRKIIERHGGRIWCESAAGARPGSGTTFSFTLPAAQPEDDPIPAPKIFSASASSLESNAPAL